MNGWMQVWLKQLGLSRFAFRMREVWRALKRRRGPIAASDGYAIPPAKLIVLVTGSADATWYTEGGRLSAESIRGLLEEAGLTVGHFSSILDFGCGCGRVIRHWRPLTRAALYGTDCNTRLIDWCRCYLPFAKFQSNALEARLDYADQQFEFAYALSVFTHTPQQMQQPWMHELRRILRPGGYLLITTQGDEYLGKLTPAERSQYERGDLLARYEQAGATNLCTMYHPEAYVRRLAQDFSWILSRPHSATGNGNQDMYLLRTPL